MGIVVEWHQYKIYFEHKLNQGDPDTRIEFYDQSGLQNIETSFIIFASSWV